ncbi:TPA: DapH/DapD/GlmU-related protein [Kluyvera cryocrescens]
MSYDEPLKKNNLYITNPSFINGDGWLEEQCVINGRLNSRFFVGAYSLIDIGCYCSNTFIGRFSIVDKNVRIGYPKIRTENNFSNHPFSMDTPFIASDEYYKKIKTSRFYYEQNKYTIIGSDVFIGQNSIIEEGCVIGDGAVIQPNTYVNFDIDDYAVIGGNPARVLGYRFDEETRIKLKKIKWWKKDISSIMYKNKPNTIDYINNPALIDELFIIKDSIPLLIKKRYHFNSNKKTIIEDKKTDLITGPSHVDLWYKKYNKDDVSKPNKYHLLPIPALSLFSQQLDNLIAWWNEWFGQVILFVPDFRIGNVCTDSKIKDGRFIRQDLVSNENSIKCFELGKKQLDKFIGNYDIKFFFWCLLGREEFNKAKNNYNNNNGNYRHPIWNYDDIIKEYLPYTIDIKKYIPNVLDSIIDASIHPTNKCYDELSKIFDSLKDNESIPTSRN